MSYNKLKSTMEYGDFVVVYQSAKSKLLHFKLTKLEKRQTQFGCLSHDDMVGKPFGSKIKTASQQWVMTMHPTPELWTEALPHRTQILYAPDIAHIIYNLDLHPGSRVAEAGTGSGSLSHSILRCIKPGGHLYTYEFNAERADTARSEFTSHGLGEWVTVTHRDVCDGGGFDCGSVDAVMLDLPQPWLAVPHAASVLRKGGSRFCSFSPCIEQSQKTCLALAQVGFTEIETFELLPRHDPARLTYCNLPAIGEELDTCLEKYLPNCNTNPSYYTTADFHTSSITAHTGFLIYATYYAQ